MTMPPWLRRIKSWLENISLAQWLFSTGAALVAGGIAIASRFLASLPIESRVLVTVGTSVMVFAVVIALTGLLVARLKPSPRVDEAELQTLRARAEDAERQALEHKANADTCRDVQAKSESRLREAEAGWKNASERARDLYETVHFGEELLHFQPLQVDDRRAVVERVQNLMPHLRRTYEGAKNVWAHLSLLIQEHGNEATKLALKRLDTKEYGDAVRVANALDGVLRDKDDPRSYLARTYTAYRQWRDQIAWVAKQLGQPVELTPGYIQWADEERRLLNELGRTLELPGLQSVGAFVQAYDEANGALKPFR